MGLDPDRDQATPWNVILGAGRDWSRTVTFRDEAGDPYPVDAADVVAQVRRATPVDITVTQGASSHVVVLAVTSAELGTQSRENPWFVSVDGRRWFAGTWEVTSNPADPDAGEFTVTVGDDVALTATVAVTNVSLGGGGGGGTDDQTAAEVPFTPAGSIAATDVQAALVELDAEKETPAGAQAKADAAQAAAEATAANADNLTSGTVADARIPATIARDTEVTAAITAHEGDVDPHGDRAYADSLAGNYDPAGSAAAVASDLSDHEAETTTAHGGIVADTDPRLTDDRDPTAHDLAGAEHNASTLAALNAKVSDATLDDSGDPRDPNPHAATHATGQSDAIAPGDIGAATAAQGALADTAVQPGDAAGGVLAGTYPNPSFAADMATQAELDAEGTARIAADAAIEAAAPYWFTYTATTDARPDWDGPVVWVDVNDVGEPDNWVTGDYHHDGNPASFGSFVTHDGTPGVGDWLVAKSVNPLVVERADAPASTDYVDNATSGLVAQGHKPVTGSALWVGPRTGTGSRVFPTETLYAVPVILAASATLIRIGIEVISAGTTGSLIRLGIYADSGENSPVSLLLDAGTVSGESTGFPNLTIAETLAPGIYWLSAVGQGTPTTEPTLRSAEANPANLSLPQGSGVDNVPYAGWKNEGVTGALPASWSSVVADDLSNVAPYVKIRTQNP